MPEFAAAFALALLGSLLVVEVVYEGRFSDNVLGLAGSAAEVTDTLGRYLACGFDYLIALFPYTRERDLLQRYAEDVWRHLP